MKDYYQILGVSEGISQEDLKKTYRKLSKQHHPDRGGDESKFKEIAEAYDTLGDPQKRETYNQRRSNPFAGGDFFGGGNPFGGGDPFDMLNRMFNQQSQQERTKRGRDLHLKIQVTLKELYLGMKKKIRYERENICKPCDGTGGEWKRCGVCKGTGKLRHIQRNGRFQKVFESVCHACSGQGKTPIKLCPNCVGVGIMTEQTDFDFQINKDFRPGERFTYPGLGNQKKGAIPGNLMVSIVVVGAEGFEMEGDDIITEIELNPLDIFLGKELEIGMYGKNFKFDLPPYFDPHQKYVLRGKGLKTSFSHGNLIVKIKLTTPTDKLDEKNIEELKKLREKLTSKEQPQ